PSRSLAQADPCPEPNDTPANACDLTPGAPVRGILDRLEDVDAYRVQVPTDSIIQLDLIDLSTDVDLFLANANNVVINQSTLEGASPERLAQLVQRGTFYAYVSTDPSRASGTTSPYTLELKINSVATPTPGMNRPIPTATAIQSDGNVLLSDNFDDPVSGLLSGDNHDPAHMNFGYTDGEFLIKTIDPDWNGAAIYTLSGVPVDVTVSVDVRVTGEADDQYVFLSCRSKDFGTTSYRFSLAPQSGVYGLVHFLNGNLLSPRTAWREWPSIHRNGQTNHLDLVCRGNTLEGSINRSNVFGWIAFPMSEGDIALGVGVRPGRKGTAEARFDNLVVRRP
ncbi:MAG: hypothetical protein U0236_23900, partial [Nitrospira sp.]